MRVTVGLGLIAMAFVLVIDMFLAKIDPDSPAVWRHYWILLGALVIGLFFDFVLPHFIKDGEPCIKNGAVLEPENRAKTADGNCTVPVKGAGPVPGTEVDSAQPQGAEGA